jgi:hypothetical protein
MLAVLAGYAVGLLQGVRHAFEPDHVAAISTVVARGAPARASVRFALVWGTGHAAALVVVGSILRALRASLPEALGAGFELAVAAMLVLLGARAIVCAGRPDSERRPSAGPPLVIGLVHGLAGSGAMAAMAMAALPTMLSGCIFLGLYGVGAMSAMTVFAGVAGASLSRVTCSRRVISGLTLATGVFSVAFGLVASWPAVGQLLKQH